MLASKASEALASRHILPFRAVSRSRRSVFHASSATSRNKQDSDAVPAPRPDAGVSPTATTASTLALMSALANLSTAGSSWADETVVAAAAASLPLGLTPAEVVLIFTPLSGYAIYKLIVVPKNPEASFNDLLLIQAGLFIFANLISILVFKTRLY